jgi:ribonucleotide monophosphatase NagD (HAD superfamily)
MIPETAIEALIERYEILLFDAYGVLVHAGGAMPGAPGLVRLLNSSGKPYCLITNDASKLPETAAARYGRFGLDIAPERIVTSGDLLARHFAAYRLAGARCAVLGTADSARYVQRAGGEIVQPEAPFEMLVVADETGYPFLQSVDEALTSLFRRCDAGDPVHLVLPNPDLIYPRGARSFGIAAGAVALMIEAALERRYGSADGGGVAPPRFVRLGKPAPDLYHEALRRLPEGHAVMIGDQLETDIRGANAAGLDSALVATGVSVRLQDVASECRPTFWLKSVGLRGTTDDIGPGPQPGMDGIDK